METEMERTNRFSPEALLAESENESTYFLDFDRQCAQYGTDAIYCFVENYDLCFYPRRVNDITGRTARGIPCDGKKNVLATYALISSKHEYDKYTQRYFVDADFDDNSSIDKHIYVTPCYSIENLYVDTTVVSDILENEYKIRRTDPSGKHEKTLNLFKSELANFHSCVLLFNAWYRTIKLKGIDSNNGVYLEDSFPSYLYKYQIKPTTTCKYSIRDIEKMFPKAPKTTAEEIERSKAYLANPKRLRGKYEIQFLYIFLEFLNTDSITAREYTVLHRGITWDRKRMISSLEQYVPTPHDMRSYIKKGIRQKI